MFDVGAGDEAPPGADQHEGFDGGVGIAALQAGDDAFRHAGAQRIDRRVVDGDDTHGAALLQSHQFGHFASSPR